MPRTRTARRSVAALLAAGTAAVLLTAAPAHAEDGCHPQVLAPQVGIVVNEDVTGGVDAVARARTWLGMGLGCSPEGTYGGYRTDAGGYASMAWGLDTSLEPSQFISAETLVPITNKNDLTVGDALLNPAPDGHVVLFAGWTDSTHTSYQGYEFTTEGVVQRAIPYPYFAGHGEFRPMRARFNAALVTYSGPAPHQFFDQVRTADDVWSQPAGVDGFGGAPIFQGSEGAVAGMPDGTSQFLAVGNDGNVYHDRHLPDGTWTPLAPLAGVGTPTMQASKVAITGLPDGSAQVVAVGNDGNVYHETRLANGSWTGFQPLNGLSGAPTMRAKEVAITALPDGSSQVAVIGSDGNVYHEIRRANGSWTGFAPLNGVGTPTMQASKVAITGLPDGTSQVVAVGNDGNVYHEIRLTSGSWTGFAPLDGLSGAPAMQASAVAVAGLSDGTTKVAAVAPDGRTYLSTRMTSGSWSGFQAVPRELDGTPATERVALTALPNGGTELVRSFH
ncbi:hypothetical protein [Kitasatospora sp. NPDC004272]